MPLAQTLNDSGAKCVWGSFPIIEEHLSKGSHPKRSFEATWMNDPKLAQMLAALAITISLFVTSDQRRIGQMYPV